MRLRVVGQGANAARSPGSLTRSSPLRAKGIEQFTDAAVAHLGEEGFDPE